MRIKQKVYLIKTTEEVHQKLLEDKVRFQKKEKEGKLSINDVIRIYQTQK